MDWDAARAFMSDYGIGLTGLIALAIAFVRPRRVNGHHRSALLVPGWLYDRALVDLELARAEIAMLRKENITLLSRRRPSG